MDPCEDLAPGVRGAPGRTTNKLEPKLEIEFSISCFTPLPIDTKAITAATPIMIPNMVKRDRNLFATKEAHAIRKLSLYIRHLLYRSHIRIDRILYDYPIFQDYITTRVRSNIRFMCN